MNSFSFAKSSLYRSVFAMVLAVVAVLLPLSTTTRLVVLGIVSVILVWNLYAHRLIVRKQGADRQEREARWKQKFIDILDGKANP